MDKSLVLVGLDGVVYLARESGIYRSGRRGEPFVLVNELGNVDDLAVDTVGGGLYALVGSELLFSDDGFSSTRVIGTRVQSMVEAGGQLYTVNAAAKTGFVAKITGGGEIDWVTYLGRYDGGVRKIAVGPDGAVYVAGPGFAGLPTGPGEEAWGGSLVKISSDGKRIVWARRIPYFGRNVAIAAYEEGVATAATRPVQISKFNSSWTTEIARFDDAGEFRRWEGLSGRYLVSLTAGTDGSLFAVGGSDVCSARPAGAGFRCLANVLGQMDATSSFLRGDELWVAGGANRTNFLSTTDSFPGNRFGPVPDNSKAALARVDVRTGTVGYATLLGGEGSESAVGVAAGGKGSVLVAGKTSSWRFPTRTPLQGPYSFPMGFLTQLTPGRSLDFSTFVGDGRGFEVVGLSSDEEGHAVVAGNSDGGVFVARYELTGSSLPRVDAVMNGATVLATPLVGGTRIRVEGEGFGDDAVVLLGDLALRVVSRTDRAVVAEVPVGLVGSEFRVAVRSGGVTSNAVFMPGGEVALGLYSVDGSGWGQGLIFNEDGTANSARNPARVGSVVQLVGSVVGVELKRAVVCSLEAPVLDGLRVRIPDGAWVPASGDCWINLWGGPGELLSQRGVTVAVRP
ncbi:MAG: hypothetical protein NTV52_16475 [Acidobacteria bacterium]|nr:hypothetical protein [Acidobacteriota bacterium]